MLIQNISAASAFRPTSDSVPVSVAAPRTEAAPVELPQAAHKAAAPQQQNTTPAQVQEAVDHINKVMSQNNANVEFSIDKDTKQTVIKVVEHNTGVVIRQFPSEEVLAISRAIDRMQHSLLVNQKA